MQENDDQLCDYREYLNENNILVNDNLDVVCEELCLQFQNAQHIRCGAHTFQLSVKDTINSPQVAQLIQKFRRLASKLRNVDKYRNLLLTHNIKIPGTEVETRWYATFFMLYEVYSIKDFYM